MDSYVKTKKGREKIKAYTWDEASLPTLTFKGLQKNHKVVKYATDFMTLDTETSHDNLERAWVYQWAVKLKNLYVYGRKPTEIIDFLIRTAEHYKLSEEKKLLIYIHNAAYDIQYLKHYLKKYDPKVHFLTLDAHAVIICDILGFRILCSYKLTNMSLSALAENYAKKYDKAVGEIDYNVIRYQDSVLTPEDWFYMFSDVAAQYDGIRGYLDAMGYRYAHEAPYTSTGFVRTNCRKASRNDPDWRQEFQNSALDLEQYNLCRWAFMGGVCIASCKYSGTTVRSDKLRHKDFTSSYPARQIINYAPSGRPSWYGEVTDPDDFQYLLTHYCCIFALTLHEVHINKGVTAPCIPSSKCFGLKEPVRLNGKIIYAKELTIAVTELDYYWIQKQYTFDSFTVDNMLIFARGQMPDWLKGEVMQYFTNKCTLKDAEDENSQLLYAKSKNFLNSIYGMTATAIIRDEYELDADMMFSPKQYEDIKEDQTKRLKKYYKGYNNFMPYQFACYTTAWARHALFTMIECVGYDNFLYCDTDSVFYIETPENAVKMEEYRQKCIKSAISAGAYVGEKYLGEPTDEPSLRAFRALHSKCYAMEEWDKKKKDYDLKVVIAGIPKKSIKWVEGQPVLKTNAEELQTIDNLKDGFTFSHCGGTRCIYIEDVPRIEDINGHRTELASGAIIDNIAKEISENMWTVDNWNIINITQEF